jgi:hypothetical protein
LINVFLPLFHRTPGPDGFFDEKASGLFLVFYSAVKVFDPLKYLTQISHLDSPGKRE